MQIDAMLIIVFALYRQSYVEYVTYE